MATKKVRMRLVGEDGNAFSILGRFQRAARQQGWAKPEIDAVMKAAQSSDYDNLLRVIVENVDEPDEEEDDDEDDDDDQ